MSTHNTSYLCVMSQWHRLALTGRSGCVSEGLYQKRIAQSINVYKLLLILIRLMNIPTTFSKMCEVNPSKPTLSILTVLLAQQLAGLKHACIDFQDPLRS